MVKSITSINKRLIILNKVWYGPCGPCGVCDSGGSLCLLNRYTCIFNVYHYFIGRIYWATSLAKLIKTYIWINGHKRPQSDNNCMIYNYNVISTSFILRDRHDCSTTIINIIQYIVYTFSYCIKRYQTTWYYV